ncbi:TonB family protein [Bacteroides faecis]|uniref:TonB family protein n=1 Tax=Bacteroides faecis TaxID=674529 RepID=UPI002287FCC3|nr:TonB family protein [Bacteroides faecis]MCS2234185.1 TonB family protein [Bacteroides faecis]MCY6310618.1 TonB family protein [Bacteroides faecis]
MNTKLFGLFLVLLVCLPSFAQQKPVEKVDSDGVYLMPDQLPEFPGGIQAMMKFLSTNIKYPVEAQKKGISGRVIVQFVIMEDGTLDQAKVIRGVDPLLDEEALRVVKSMPKWKPGMDRGEAVKVRFTAPIMFNLSRKDTPRPNFPELVVPLGQEVENRSLQGVWQSCSVQPGEHGYKILLFPVLKIVSADQTFMNIMTAGMDGKSNAVIYCQGEYSLPSDNTYVEMVDRSLDPTFIQGTKNEISVERLHDNLIKLSFTVPGQERRWTEYWFRVPSPNVRILAD